MIEISNLFKLLIKSKKYIIFLMLAGLLLGWLNSSVIPDKFTVTTIVSLVRKASIEENINSTYQYDGYYLIESSRLYGERLGYILKNPSFSNELNSAFGDYVAIKHVERMTTADYRVSIKVMSSDLEEVRQVLETKISRELSAAAKETGEYSDFEARVSVFSDEPSLSPYRQMAIGSGIGALAAILFVLFRYYFKGDQL